MYNCRCRKTQNWTRSKRRWKRLKKEGPELRERTVVCYCLEWKTQNNREAHVCLFCSFFLLMAVLDLHCCVGCSPAAVPGPLISVASPVDTGHRVWTQAIGCGHRPSGVDTGHRVCRLEQLQHVGSVVEAHRLSCFTACGIFPDEGSQPVSPTLSLQWSP